MLEGVAELAAVLARAGVIADAGEVTAAERLAGGVSSDIWRVDTKARSVCVKQALARLKVAETWEVPVARNRYEYRWYQVANRIVPGSAPEVIAADDAAGFFVMSYLPPDHYPLWKTELAAGRASTQMAAAVGAALATIHSATFNAAAIAREFATDAAFESIRLEPYLRFTATRHVDLAGQLNGLADDLARNRIGLVHGDASPKNILLGPGGPVFLDAECAWYGDVVFDPAFCLNHLLLKSVWRPSAHAAFQASFRALWQAYLAGVDWEDPAALERRCAKLLPALLLARIDGKSPVEYITDAVVKDRVCRIARQLILDPPASLDIIQTIWNREWAP